MEETIKNPKAKYAIVHPDDPDSLIFELSRELEYYKPYRWGKPKKQDEVRISKTTYGEIFYFYFSGYKSIFKLNQNSNICRSKLQFHLFSL